MKHVNVLLFFSISILFAGCTSTNVPRTMTDAEASEFENSLKSPENTLSRPDFVFTQPVNKDEPCKLPSSTEQMARTNFRAFWDGECRNGFAYGLGRDIAISDTHHVEEITIHNGTGDNWSNPRVLYDFVNNSVGYSVGGSEYPAQVLISETYNNSYNGFTVKQTISKMDNDGNEFLIQTSPFDTVKTYVATNNQHSYGIRFSDNSAAPLVNPNAAIFMVDILDLNKNLKGGVQIVRYGNGVVQHFKIVNGEPQERVTIPADYLSHLETVYQTIKNSTSAAISQLTSAQQMEREYLFKVCNGKSSINGLDKDTYTKICTWRDQFKESYIAASERFQKQLENMNENAKNAEQQRQVQQQIALQQQIIQQQQNQQTWNEINRTTEQIQQTSQQILQSVNGMKVPQVQPLNIPGRNVTICHTIGSIVTCQ